MSDIPSTEFDSEIEFTTGTDALMGDGGDNLFLAEASGTEDSGLNTLNGSDTADGKGGTDTLRFATSGNDNILLGNFTLMNIETWEARNQVDGDVEVNFAFSGGIDTFWFNQNFGDYSWYTAVQDAAGLVFSGGDTAVDIDFANSVTMDSLDVLLDGATVDDLYVNYYGGGMIPTVNIHSQGGPNELGLWSWGATAWNISGDADLDVEHLGGSNGDSEANTLLTTVDATGLTGDLTLDVENMGGGPLKVLTGTGADTLYLDPTDGDEGEFDIVVKTGKNNDKVYLDDFKDANVQLGRGKNFADLEDMTGESILVGGGGSKDEISVHATNVLGLTTVNGKKGFNDVDLDVSGSAVVMGRGGKDWLSGSADVDLTATLGSGLNYIDTWSGRNSNITTGSKYDEAYAYAGDNLVANFGDGGGLFEVGAYNSSGILGPEFALDVTTGNGADLLWTETDNGGNLKATLAQGADYITVNRVDGYFDVGLGTGADAIRTGTRGVESSDILRGGDGYDGLIVGRPDDSSSAVNGLQVLTDNGPGALGGVSGIEYISVIDDGSSVTVEFSGKSSGANDAGIKQYMFSMDEGHPVYGPIDDTGIDSSYDLQEMAGGVMLDIAVDGSYLDSFGLELDEDAEDKSADINFDVAVNSWTTFGDVDISNTETLNITLMDNDIFDDYYDGVTFGQGNTFEADSALETIILSGDANISMEGIVAPNLSEIDGSAMTGDVLIGSAFTDPFTPGISNVGPAINVYTGTGNDQVISFSSGTEHNIETNAGSDIVLIGNNADDVIKTGQGGDVVFSGMGEDDIYLGKGDDSVFFNAGELTSADLIAGGEGYDTVTVLSNPEADTGLTGGDDFFYQWSGNENLVLSDDDDNLTLHTIADDSGLLRIDLSQGGNDTITIGEGFHRNDSSDLLGPFIVELGDGSANPRNIKVFGRDSDTSLLITGTESVFTDDENLKGGTGDGDTIEITADGGDAVFGNQVKFFENVVIKRNGDTDVSLTTHNANVADGERLLVDASNLIAIPDPDGHAAGDLFFEGAAEINGSFDVIGGQGNDFITTGRGDDTVDGGEGGTLDTQQIINTGRGSDTITVGDGVNNIVTDDVAGQAGNGADTVTAGNGGNFVDTRDGADDVTTGSGADTILAGAGMDTVRAGAGADKITGGEGADNLSGGIDSDQDTFFYAALEDSFIGARDIINDFTSGQDTINLAGLGATIFKGNATDPTDLTGRLAGDGTTIEAVFELATDILWVDMDGDGVLNDNDVSIELAGVGDAGGLLGTDLIYG